ncbi:MAG: hypothetical protein U5R14_10740 [Gemmatimonadota bacterium]|nr:hypothetical protein [Gemmatimonadota bacterium]
MPPWGDEAMRVRRVGRIHLEALKVAPVRTVDQPAGATGTLLPDPAL